MDPKVRCDKARMNVSTTPSVPTGGLNKLFNKIVDNFSNTYDITVLSKDPWVITFDNFLTDEEVAGFLVATNNSIDTWSKSVEFTGSDSFGNAHRTETQARTSTSLWCDSDTCTNHPSTRSISRKISELLGMPNVERQSESFQVSCISSIINTCFHKSPLLLLLLLLIIVIILLYGYIIICALSGYDSYLSMNLDNFIRHIMI
jgi:hypothetical protein